MLARTLIFNWLLLFLRKTSVGEKSLTKGQVSGSKDVRPKSAPPSKAPPGDQSVENGDSSKNSNKTDAEILSELRAEMDSKKKNRPVSGRKRSARKRKKSLNVAQRQNSQTDPSCEDTVQGEDEVLSGMDLMRVEGRGGDTKLSPRVDPRKARMRELAEKRCVILPLVPHFHTLYIFSQTFRDGSHA